jgi:dihydrofolate reductase
VTLDGVMEAPGHEIHPDGKNAWALQHSTEDMQRFKLDELDELDATDATDATDAILLGRVIYQIFASFWPGAVTLRGVPGEWEPFEASIG